MEDDFYRGRLTDKHGLQVLVPDEKERQAVHDVIYRELCLGTIKQESKRQYADIMGHLVRRGAQGIVLGRTEIGFLVGQDDSEIPVPVFDTTEVHARAAVEYALKE